MTVVLIPIVFASLMLYYAVPIVRRRPSPGACVLGYQILPDAGWELTFSQALSRTFAGFLAVAGCWLAPFVAREPKAGKFWLDRLFHTHAVRLE